MDQETIIYKVLRKMAGLDYPKQAVILREFAQGVADSCLGSGNGSGRRDLYRAAALQGLLVHSFYTVSGAVRMAKQIGDAMLTEDTKGEEVITK